MQLSTFSAALGLPTGADLAGVEITGVTHNSSWVEPGALFVALRGANTDGHAYLPQALQRGAVAVMGEGMPDGVACPVPYLTVAHGREALADAAAELAGHPSRGMGVVGVTGTDGKTTTAWMTRHLLRAVGVPTGFLSTVGYELPDGELRQFPAHFTTPEAPQVQGFLAELRAAGAQAVVLEASSHALAMDRVRAVDWDVAVWTNLTSEHLDFHGSVEAYFAEKRKLVERAKHAVLNLDDPWTERLRGIAPTETTYSADGDARADWWAEAVSEGPRGIDFRLHSPLGSGPVQVPMVGTFNVANALAALAAAAHLSGANLEALVAGVASQPGVPGRMELVPAPD
ncbi:MAG: UDP-N-acetylmuramyl-tripeptide synthetase, partial [Ruaniaceae bacterium]|nr:UDP-N-acetylmuramyl-tripeptide synthetase [Ruaniaceae bacterium]